MPGSPARAWQFHSFIGVNPLQTTWPKRGIVSGRVALLPRSAEIQPPFHRFSDWTSPKANHPTHSTFTPNTACPPLDGASSPLAPVLSKSVSTSPQVGSFSARPPAIARAPARRRRPATPPASRTMRSAPMGATMHSIQRAALGFKRRPYP